MGKCLASLVALAASLLLIDKVFADEQVRRVQEELRKRHLFYAEANGEKSAALALALKYYQAKKGFAPTGVLDPVTLASLGISPTRPFAAKTPITIAKRGQIHGANGERLPDPPPFLLARENKVNQLDPGLIGREYIGIELTDFAWQRMQRAPGLGKSVRLTSSPDGGGPLSKATFDAPIRPISFDLASSVWDALHLPPGAEESRALGEIDDKRTDQADANPTRRSHRRPRRAEPRKEKNPLILTYRSVDRAIRSLFGDTQSKKKRSITKRL